MNEWKICISYESVNVINGGMVYDKMTGAAGMPLNNYKQLFEYADDLIFEKVKIMTVK